jgi:tRNA (cytidine/uridine-2'-O-)-methyltransferase
MFDVVLYEPEIAPNTGNVIRLCANTGAKLHLIEPLGFEPDDAKLRRAGLDYHDWAQVKRHANWAAAQQALTLEGKQLGVERRIFALTTKGHARYDKVAYRPGDVFLFGPESRGLPPEVLNGIEPSQRLRLAMQPNNRSLSLSNAVAVMVYEAWRQNGFEGGS